MPTYGRFAQFDREFATWQYGPEQRPGEAHVMWRRIGTHTIFRNP